MTFYFLARFILHFDTDGSGKLTTAELKRALEALRMGSDRVRVFVNVFANDKDGFISKVRPTFPGVAVIRTRLMHPIAQKEFLECLSPEMLEELQQHMIKGALFSISQIPTSLPHVDHALILHRRAHARA